MSFEYLYKQAGSQKWHAKFPPIGGRKQRRFSLGTADLATARLLVLPHVQEHLKIKAALPRLQFKQVWKPDYLPGLRTLPDGRQVFATERDLLVLDAAGNDTGERLPNGHLEADFVGPWPDASTPAGQKIIHNAFMGNVKPEKPKADSDDALMDDYLANGSIKTKSPITNPWKQKEARASLALFKALTKTDALPGGKALKDATYDDAMAMVAHWRGQKNVGESINKKLGWLVQCCNRGIATGKIKMAVNPFSAARQSTDDSEDVPAFTDDDMKIIRAKLGTLRPDYQLLMTILATMGVRPIEAFEIEGELVSVDGVRCCRVGANKRKTKKGKASKRYVPFSPQVLAMIPDKIEGRLLPESLGADYDARAKERLGDFVHSLPFEDMEGKRVYSARHYFNARLKTLGATQGPGGECERLMGHCETINDRYGNEIIPPLKWATKFVDNIWS